jgi:hypothetical protein
MILGFELEKQGLKAFFIAQVGAQSLSFDRRKALTPLKPIADDLEPAKRLGIHKMTKSVTELPVFPQGIGKSLGAGRQIVPCALQGAFFETKLFQGREEQSL